jgi:uncharacterized protein (TIGR02147 family)
MLQIYGYFDLLEFLKDDFQERKKRNPMYSLRAMADKLGLNSATIVRIMNGERNVSKNMVSPLISYLGLRSREAEYFTNLVSFCQAKSEKVRNESYNVLTSLCSGKNKIIATELYEYYEEWYYTAIRELLRVYPFDGDYKTLANMLTPKITVPEVKKALEVLLRLEFIERIDNTFVVREHNITTGAKWQGAAIKGYQKATLKLALHSFDILPKEELDFSTMTMCYSADGYAKVRALLKKTREELNRIEEQDAKKSRVFQINLQLFPLSEKISEDKNEN